MKTNIIQTWTELGPWHKGPSAPNGSVPGQLERTCTQVTIYYGQCANGNKAFMDTWPLFQTEGQPGPLRQWGGTSDGNLDSIERRAARAGVVLM